MNQETHHLQYKTHHFNKEYTIFNEIDSPVEHNRWRPRVDAAVAQQLRNSSFSIQSSSLLIQNSSLFTHLRAAHFVVCAEVCAAMSFLIKQSIIFNTNFIIFDAYLCRHGLCENAGRRAGCRSRAVGRLPQRYSSRYRRSKYVLCIKAHHF